jgi:dolichol-phosphate mannosyltransferase
VFLLKFSNTTVIIATLDEEAGIKPTLIELQKTLKDSKFLVADGGSKDNTVTIAKDLGATTFLQNGTGKGNAIRQSLKRVILKSSFVVFIDADYTYPASKQKDMISILDANPDVGMVIGARFYNRSIAKCLTNPFFFGNRLIALVHWILNGLKLSDPLSGLRVVRYSLIKNWSPKSDGFDIESELNCYINKSHYRIVEVPVEYRHRLGNKKLGFKHAFNILNRIIREI